MMMNCPACGKEMKAGKIAYAPQAGIHFLPPGVQHLPRVVTKWGIKKQDGIVLDGPSNLGLLESDGTLPAYLCQQCRKIIVEY